MSDIERGSKNPSVDEVLARMEQEAILEGYYLSCGTNPPKRMETPIQQQELAPEPLQSDKSEVADEQDSGQEVPDISTHTRRFRG